MGILRKSIETAIALGASRIEIEYKDGQELIAAFVNCVGFGIDSVQSSRNAALFRELAELEKAKQLASRGKTYRLEFSEYDSFGEPVHVINIAGAGISAAEAEPQEDDPFGLWEGECVGCDIFGRVDDVGLCEECAAKLDRDLIRQRDWAYSASAYGRTLPEREALRAAVLKQYGDRHELISEPERPKPVKRPKKHRRRRK